MLIKRFNAGIECAIWDEQCWFRQGRVNMDQVFAVRQMCGKYLSNIKNLFWAYMGLEQAYNTIYLHGMWQMLRLYGVR